jgi:NADH-quinone oxidoreductase subunit G
VADLYTTRAALVIANDIAQQHPLVHFRLRENWRHHQNAPGMHLYTVTPGPVREDSFAYRRVRYEAGADPLAEVKTLGPELAKEPELVVIFGDEIKGDRLRDLVSWLDSLGIASLKFVCLVDYANSRGAADMGLIPGLLPGYKPTVEGGLNLAQMLASEDLDVLWVVGANPLRRAELRSANAFVVVQDLFLTEAAQRADVVLPAGSAYEKDGTVTNVTGEVQRLKRGHKVMGTKTDLEIFGLLAKEMKWDAGVEAKPESVFEIIRKTVHGYDVPLPVLATGGAAQAVPVNGRISVETPPELIQSSRDTLFTSGSLGRHSKALQSVLEYPGTLYGSPVETP